jgi:hypothetical protein
LARKGVLINDPGFRALTPTELMFEYVALRTKEREDRKFVFDLVQNVFTDGLKALRWHVISLLGLNIGAESLRDKDSTEIPHIPLVMYLAQPEVIKEMMERDKNASRVSPAQEEAFETMSDYFMNADEAIFDPLFTGEDSKDPKERYLARHQEMLRSMGINLTEDEKTNLPDLSFDE